LKQAKLEILAEALPIPILFESRRKKLKRFLKLEILKIERIWFPCLKEMLKQPERFTIKGLVYITIYRRSLGAINILMVSLIYDKRARAIYWEILDKKGSSNLEEQKRVLEKVTKEGVYQEMRGLGLSPGTQLFLNDINITKERGFGQFNLAGKWKKTWLFVTLYAKSTDKMPR
jgi:hypothetical protein